MAITRESRKGNATYGEQAVGVTPLHALLERCDRNPQPTCSLVSPKPSSQTHPAMSTAATSYYFRRRTIGRAASPPTWACYEQIPYDDDDYSDSCSDSCSEDDDDYPRSAAIHDEPISSDSDDKDDDGLRNSVPADVTHAMDMDEDHLGSEADRQKPPGEPQKDVKGKQKVADPEPEDRKRNRKKHQRPMYTLRPILTIHKSQGFVWNQASYL